MSLLGPWLPIPILPAVVALAVAFGWVSLSASAERRAAVRAERARVLAEVNLAAAEQRIAAMGKIAARAEAMAKEERARNEAAEAALTRLEEAARQSALDQENLGDEIDELMAAPRLADCVVDGALLERLRAR